MRRRTRSPGSAFAHQGIGVSEAPCDLAGTRVPHRLAVPSQVRERSAPTAPEQASIDLPDEAEAGDAAVAQLAATRQPWSAALPEQMRAVADVLAAVPGAHDEAALAERFTGRGPWKKRLPQILQTLEALGWARREGERWRA